MTSTYPVAFSEQAIEDLAEISLWIVGQADKDVAHRYVERLKAFALRIGGYPHGVTPRDEFAQGMRSATFERRYLIIYRVESETVIVMRIVSSYRDVAAVLAGPPSLGGN